MFRLAGILFGQSKKLISNWYFAGILKMSFRSHVITEGQKKLKSYHYIVKADICNIHVGKVRVWRNLEHNDR